MKASVVNNKALSLCAMYYDFDEFLLIGGLDETKHRTKIKEKKKKWKEYYEDIQKYYDIEGILLVFVPYSFFFVN